MNLILPGRVSRSDGTGVWVVVPKLGTDERKATHNAHWYQTEEMGDPALTLPPQEGDNVVVALLGGSISDLHVMGLRA